MATFLLWSLAAGEARAQSMSAGPVSMTISSAVAGSPPNQASGSATLVVTTGFTGLWRIKAKLESPISTATVRLKITGAGISQDYQVLTGTYTLLIDNIAALLSNSNFTTAYTVSVTSSHGTGTSTPTVNLLLEQY